MKATRDLPSPLFDSSPPSPHPPPFPLSLFRKRKTKLGYLKASIQLSICTLCLTNFLFLSIPYHFHPRLHILHILSPMPRTRSISNNSSLDIPENLTRDVYRHRAKQITAHAPVPYGTIPTRRSSRKVSFGCFWIFWVGVVIDGWRAMTTGALTSVVLALFF